jgi:hypothetical protein
MARGCLSQTGGCKPRWGCRKIPGLKRCALETHRVAAEGSCLRGPTVSRGSSCITLTITGCIIFQQQRCKICLTASAQIARSTVKGLADFTDFGGGGRLAAFLFGRDSAEGIVSPAMEAKFGGWEV